MYKTEYDKVNDAVKAWVFDNASKYENIGNLVSDAAKQFSVESWLDRDFHPIWDWATEAIERTSKCT